jgi:hypothetical protein
VLCQARSWQVGPVKKDMSPVALRVVIYCAPPTCEERGRGNARTDTDCPNLRANRGEGKSKARDATRARRGAFRRRRVR